MGNIRLLMLVVTLCLTCGCMAQDAAPAAVAEAAPDALSWPRKVDEGGNSILVYQPEFEKWDGTTLDARAAVGVTPAESKKQTFGVIWFTARTQVDKPNRVVTLEDIDVKRAAFPQDKPNEQAYLAMIRQHAHATATVPLDHFEAALTASSAARGSEGMDVENKPPKIIFSKKPSILILIDGEPALRPVEGSQAMRVINTRALILLDAASKKYYLTLMGRWVHGPSPLGPWAAAEQTPAGFDEIRATLARSKEIDVLEPKDPKGAPQGLPEIFSSDQPAELVQSRGEPLYTPIAGTELLYMNNSESAIFRAVGSGENYVLISGRWFKAADLNGPWAYIAAKDLPPDFAKIPASSPKANALVSVPGTPQAQQAVVANSIPQMAAVKTAEAKTSVSYDGQPAFKPITGTAGLEYAANAALPVIRVPESKQYYCVVNGVWFVSNSPNGPWVVAEVVPPVIYTIPVSSPLHYVTYVKVYGKAPGVVYYGYTPGYMGTCVTREGVVVYGTGYYYPAYVGAYWVGYPVTYGYGAGFACGYATGFAYGFAAGSMIGDCWMHPYWGPCYGYGSVNINSHSCYTNWAGGVTTVNRHYSYNYATNTASAWGRGSSFNPYSGRASVGGYSGYIDYNSGNFDGRAGGATYNPQTGVISGRGVEASGNYKDGDIDVNRAGFKYNTNTQSGVAHYNNNVYADHDGNVYKHTDNGWEEHTSSGWQPLLKGGSTNAMGETQRQNLEAQRGSRNLGQQRYEGTRNYGSYERAGLGASEGGARDGSGLRDGGGLRR